MSNLQSLFKSFVPVFVRRHEPYTGHGEVGDPERFIYNSMPTPCNAVGPHEDPNIDRHFYAAGALAMFGLDRTIPGEHMRAVYLLRMWSSKDAREYFKLSFALEDGEYKVRAMPDEPPETPRFYVFKDPGSYAGSVKPVYEHTATIPVGASLRYKYDFEPKGSNGWSDGTVVFYAITPEDGKQALEAGSANGDAAKAWAKQWLANNAAKVAAAGKVVSKNMTRGQADAIVDVVLGTEAVGQLGALPKPTFYSVGVGAHAGVGLASAGVDIGSIWFANDFPTRNPIASYSNESVTLGIAGVDLGVSVDAVFGIWFGTVDQIEGACMGVCGAVQAIGGVTITLLWTGTWEGANYTGHPIGVAITASVGPDIGGGIFYIASATQFWRKQPNFPKTRVPHTLAAAHLPESDVANTLDASHAAAE